MGVHFSSLSMDCYCQHQKPVAMIILVEEGQTDKNIGSVVEVAVDHKEPPWAFLPEPNCVLEPPEPTLQVESVKQVDKECLRSQCLDNSTKPLNERASLPSTTDSYTHALSVSSTCGSMTERTMASLPSTIDSYTQALSVSSTCGSPQKYTIEQSVTSFSSSIDAKSSVACTTEVPLDGEEESGAPVEAASEALVEPERPNFQGTWVITGIDGDYGLFMADTGASQPSPRQNGLDYGMGTRIQEITQEGDAITIANVTALGPHLIPSDHPMSFRIGGGPMKTIGLDGSALVVRAAWDGDILVMKCKMRSKRNYPAPLQTFRRYLDGHQMVVEVDVDEAKTARRVFVLRGK